MDWDLRYFEATAQVVGHARREGMIEVVDTHRGGVFATATIYKPAGNRTLEHVRQIFGCDALSEIRNGDAA